MATDHPAAPNDPKPPIKPDPLPEEALFEDLPLSGTPIDDAPPGDAPEEVIDLSDDDTLLVDPADILAVLPPTEPASANSGWLDAPSSQDSQADNPLGLLPEGSDIFSDAGRSGSDVLRSHPASDASNSNIFGSPGGSSLFGGSAVSPEGSSLFGNSDASSEGSNLFGNSAVLSEGSSLFDSSAAPPEGSSSDLLASDPDAELFADLEKSLPPENEGAEPLQFKEASSEISLAAPDDVTLPQDPSSIFTPIRPDEPSVEINIEESALATDEDSHTDALAFAEDSSGPASHIFSNTRLPETGEAQPPTSAVNESEVINWAEPGDWGEPPVVVPESADEEDDILAAANAELAAAAADEEPAAVAPLMEPNVIESDGVEPEVVDEIEPEIVDEMEPRVVEEEEPEVVEEELPRPRTRARRTDDESAPVRGGSRGWIGGGALGLLAGVGACAAAYFGGLLPTTKSTPAVTQAPAVVQTAPPAVGPTVADAHALLASGQPVKALQEFEKAGEAASPEVKAARGQARWQARLRELAETGTPVKADDPQLQKAEADLQAVVASAGSLKTAPEKQAAARAALQLGLLKELSGDAAGAAKVYTDAATKFPASRRVFDTALARLRLTQQSNKIGQLMPRQADELARLSLFALVLLQAPTEKAAPEKLADEEAGFLFWEAVNHAAVGDYVKAIEAIRQAKTLHERRRLKFVGRGSNPLSDPLEQIFSRTCDDLRDYWTLKQELYGYPRLGPVVQKEGVTKFLGDVTKLQAEASQFATLKSTNAELQKRITDMSEKLKTSLAAATKAGQDKERIAKDLRERTQQLTDAEAKVADAMTKRKAAETMLASAVKELKANKLIDDKDDVAAALAKLPDVLKKASAAATSINAKKAAKALLQAQVDVKTAHAETKAAQAKVSELTAEMKQAQAAAAKKLAAAHAETKAARAATAKEVKKAVAQAEIAAEKAQTQLAAQKQATKHQLQTAQQEFARKLAAKEETFRRQMADMRAGIVVPLSATEQAAKDRASQYYNSGIELYFTGRYADAASVFAAATRSDTNDARYWYFLGLSQFAEGKRESANAAFRKGAALEARNQPPARFLNAALERVQGPARQALNAYRP